MFEVALFRIRYLVVGGGSLHLTKQTFGLRFILSSLFVRSASGESGGDGEQLEHGAADIITRDGIECPASGGKPASSVALRRVRRLSTAEPGRLRGPA